MLKRYATLTILCLALSASLLWAQANIVSTGNQIPAADNALDLGISSAKWRALYVNNLNIGGSATPVTQIKVYAPSLTPAATSAAIQTSSQTFTVTGLATTDKVFVNGPAPTSLCPLVGARVSATNTLALDFTVLTASACTPAPGTYNIVAMRS